MNAHLVTTNDKFIYFLLTLVETVNAICILLEGFLGKRMMGYDP